MKKLIFAGALLLLATSMLSARQPHAKVQVSFFTPLGTNGKLSPDYTNDFSLNLLAGVSRNERKLALAGWANIIHGDARGLQMAGLINHVGHHARGLQMAGLINRIGNSANGMQIAGLTNYLGGEGRGFAAAGLTNIVRGDYSGFQMAGLANFAGDVKGMQMGGLLNVAKNVRGVQMAALVNVADHSDYPIGLVNIIRDGEMGIALSYNEIGTSSITFRSGGRVMYGILGMGYNDRVDRRRDAMSMIAGLGAHVEVAPWLRINNELAMEYLDSFDSGDQASFKVSYALLPALRLGRRFELFGGPNISYMQSEHATMRDLFPDHSMWNRRRTDRWQQVHIGWQAGVQFIF